MNNKYKSIILNGFRGSGKSTIGRLLAEKLNWNYVEMDYIIEQTAGMSINALTKGGTTWQKFRQMEHELLQELIEQENIVISAGGGVGVNSIVKQGVTATFGKINSQIMKEAKNTLIIVLLAGVEVLAKRLHEQEMQNAEITRPILSEEKAKEIAEEIKQFNNDPEKQKAMIVDAIIETEMKLYKIRKPLYENLSDHIFDTGKLSVDEVMNQIIALVRNQN